MGWSKKGERAIVETPTTRAQTTTILGAISPHGIINVKGFYIVMDNVPIHKNTDIERYIINRGYGCVYLPPYSPELNPIEQFWSVVKSKLKREKLLEKETLTSRISNACNDVLLSDLQGFCRYSDSKWQVCLDKLPL
ncbi:hypothetical protein RO3G_04587 [Rhizopus delemar RA 99-880]|uniref:Tc1-like transposase DDE domain-containing protein n=1 Tax=Rhizopus delemar (strain RA 99-880 / ATCC MYA-4621 / FGSC 9543 / NRRL 43880) TaxID=246409 RepID=I1BUK2_RHIO9|nr:hypothetical protein RO3G_04587 [Rhizopus delemar RA 99-880]|eukprot:EIE79882.1 hypothetical protein RO3G_04587 [Rhizopus delemar RA 99-880]